MAEYLTFDVTQFRATYTEFSDPLKYPDAVLQNYWDIATCYISNENYGYLSGDCRQLAINLMTAHLAKIADLSNSGQLAILAQAASIDKISVSLTPPPLKNQFAWWLSTTAYGQQLYALLQARSVGGFYVGGLPEKSAFRRVGGIFT